MGGIGEEDDQSNGVLVRSIGATEDGIDAI